MDTIAGLDEPALKNIMLRYIASLAAGEYGRDHVERHFATRLRQGFQLAEIVDELALLGRCVMERVYLGPRVDPRPRLRDGARRFRVCLE